MRGVGPPHAASTGSRMIPCVQQRRAESVQEWVKLPFLGRLCVLHFFVLICIVTVVLLLLDIVIYRCWDVLGVFFGERERERERQENKDKSSPMTDETYTTVDNCLAFYSSESSVVLRLLLAFQFWVLTEVPVLQLLQLATVSQLDQNLGKDGRVR